MPFIDSYAFKIDENGRKQKRFSFPIIYSKFIAFYVTYISEYQIGFIGGKFIFKLQGNFYYFSSKYICEFQYHHVYTYNPLLAILN